MPDFRLGVLDQSPIPDGQTGGDALRNTLDLAKLTDELGYDRYWIAEHHGSPGLALAAPEVMIGPIALATQRIRVGSGGIMLPHYSPLKVAETFSMLSALAPGRIDLGIGRAAGTDGLTARALQRDRSNPMPDDFSAQLDELLSYFENRRSPKHPLRRMATLPGGTARPEPWLLGSSPQSAIWAGELGLPYCFADFINPAGAEIAQLYRDHFTPGIRLAEPHLAVAAWAIAADTDDEANALALSWRMMMTLLQRGQLISVPTVATSEQFFREEPEGMTLRRRAILGTGDAVRAGIESLAEEYGADEVFLVNILHDHAARRHSYELIAEAFELNVARVSSRTVR